MTDQTSPSIGPAKARIWSILGRLSGSSTGAIFLALVLVCVVMSFLSDRFFTASNLGNIVSQSSIVGIAAVGATLIIITGGIDLSVGAVIGLSGMLAALFVQDGANGILGILAAIVIAVGVSSFNAFSVTFLKLAPFIVTLATLGMARGLTLQASEATSVYDLPQEFTYLGGATLYGVQLPIIITIFAFIAGHITLTKTTFGRSVYAVGGNREAARLSGIRVNQVIIFVYLIAGVCTGIAAMILIGRLGSATPTAGTGIEIQVIAAVVIGGTSLFGGKGSMVGTLVGVLLIGVINNGLTLLNVSPYWVQFMQGALIFVAIVLDSANSRRLSRVALKKRSRPAI